MPHKQTTGRYINEAEALSLVRRRLDAGLPVGAPDLRALGVSLATDRYNRVLRIALAERGLTRRPRVHNATHVGMVAPDVANTPTAVADTLPTPIPVSTITPRPQVVLAARDVEVAQGGVARAVAGACRSALQRTPRLLRGLWTRAVTASSLFREMVRVATNGGSTAGRR